MTLEDVPPLPQDSMWKLVIRVQPAPSAGDKLVKLGTFRSTVDLLYNDVCEGIMLRLQNLSHFIPIKKTNLQ